MLVVLELLLLLLLGACCLLPVCFCFCFQRRNLEGNLECILESEGRSA